MADKAKPEPGPITFDERELRLLRQLVDEGYSTAVMRQAQVRVQGKPGGHEVVQPSGRSIDGIKAYDWVRELAAKLDAEIAKLPEPEAPPGPSGAK